jgi:hypothetical protein
VHTLTNVNIFWFKNGNGHTDYHRFRHTLIDWDDNADEYANANKYPNSDSYSNSNSNANPNSFSISVL